MIVLSVGFSYSAQSQNYNHYLKYAERALNNQDDITAIKMFEKYLAENPNKKKVKLRLAECYLNTKQFHKAEATYKELLSEGNAKPIVLFNYAKSLKAQGKYEEAISAFSECIKHSKERALSIKCRLMIDGCNNALEAIKDSQDVKIFNLERVNNNHQESSPVYINDTLMIYSAIKADSILTISVYDSTNIPRSQLYLASLVDSTWIPKESTQISLNSTKYNIANGAFDPYLERYYYTQCEKNWQNKTICSLCVTTYSNGKFGDTYVIDKQVNSSRFTNAQPAVAETYNPDIEIIYFASDRPNGFGGMDIWYITYNMVKRSFSKPKNAGAKINTRYNEVTPFYNDKTKTIYFSSDRPEGYGGYDIYKANGSARKWYPTVNEGYPINTNADDLYYNINDDQINGFIVSNRLGSKKLTSDFCCYDIYGIKIKNNKKVVIKGSFTASIDPTIKKLLNRGLELTIPEDELGIRNMEVAMYKYFEETPDSMFIAKDTLQRDGSYELVAERNSEYKLFFYDENEIEGSIEVSTENTPENYEEIVLEPTKTDVMPKQALIVNDINYDFGSSELSEEAKQAIDSSIVLVLKENKRIKVEISSHTDSVGNSGFNMKLSEQRAKNVVRYLVSRGIDKSRLIARGYGKMFPLVPNTNPDGSDNVEGRRKNRRTEFKIVGKVEKVNRKGISVF
jgi:OOP family OmpA-OmpF porin